MKTTITRRVFIASSLLAGTAMFLLPQGAKTNVNIEPFKVIEAVQEVLFPKGLHAPSASEFGATNYLAVVSTHSSFVKDDLRFLKEGASKLMEEEPEFLKMNPKDQDETLREFSESKIGRNWTSLLLFYTIEALLSDPIYGGNRGEKGWQWLNHHTGKPQPKERFAKRSVRLPSQQNPKGLK